MNSVQRFLVDKKLVEVNGEYKYKLYFFDVPTGVVIEYIADLVEGTIPELKEHFTPKEDSNLLETPDSVEEGFMSDLPEDNE